MPAALCISAFLLVFTNLLKSPRWNFGEETNSQALSQATQVCVFVRLHVCAYDCSGTGDGTQRFCDLYRGPDPRRRPAGGINGLHSSWSHGPTEHGASINPQMSPRSEFRRRVRRERLFDSSSVDVVLQWTKTLRGEGRRIRRGTSAATSSCQGFRRFCGWSASCFLMNALSDSAFTTTQRKLSGWRCFLSSCCWCCHDQAEE